MKLIILLFLVLPRLAVSQGYLPGYVILNTGDTVHGSLKHPFGSHYGFVFKDSSKIKKDFPREEVAGFFIEKQGLYRNIVFEKDGQMHMVFVTIQGYLSFYEVQLGSSSDSYFYILEKTGDKSQCWYTADLFSGFKDKLTNYLGDDGPLCDKIRQGIYTRKNILSIVTEYNLFHSNN